jgi:hypothetical protein
MSRPIRLREMSRTDRTPLIHLETEDLMPLPVPLESPEKDHPWVPVSEQCKAKYECGLDDTCALNIPKPKTPEEEKQLVARFLSGLDKLSAKRTIGCFCNRCCLRWSTALAARHARTHAMFSKLVERTLRPLHLAE